MTEYKKEIASFNKFYQAITEITFNPIECVFQRKPIVKKGETYWWKWLKLIPLFKVKAKTDLYSGYIKRFETLNEIKSYNGYDNGTFYEKNGNIYKKANIEIEFGDNKWKTDYFNSNEEAKDYFNTLKLKCKMHNNEMR